MSNNAAIQVYLRVRPTDKPFEGTNIIPENNLIEFYVKKDPKDGYVNNSKEKRVYQFNELFDMTTKQNKVFDKVAKEVCDNALKGYNGTIFAYGQTGSGKTFTMTGGTQDYQARGIIPRTFEYLFAQSSKRSTEEISIYASYIQIYNGVGYDLCPEGKDKDYKRLQDLQKIVHRQDADGQTHLINLSVHELKNQSDALGMLFQGDTHRVVCKTPMNDESTRSHCIFKIIVEVKKTGSDIKTTSTIHLVDLSGSERIKNTDVEGKMQYEARNINLTLHFLERVITSLSNKMKGENIVIPYRQSLLTMILRNSLGGNCKTKMVATISAKQRDIPQTISTCQFARRISCIQNSVFKNQSVDPQVIITKLRNENSQLRAELALLKGGDDQQFLDQYDIEDCHNKINDYIGNPSDGAVLVFSDRLRIQECYNYFKTLIKSGGKFSAPSKSAVSSDQPSHKQLTSAQRQKYEQELKKLTLLTKRQQQEITILLNEIKKYSKPVVSVPLAAPVETEEQRFYRSQKQNIQHQPKLILKNAEDKLVMSNDTTKGFGDSTFQKSEMSSIKGDLNKSKLQVEREEINKMLLKPHNLSNQEMLDHTRLCEDFRKSYKKQETIMKNETILKQKLLQGKECHKAYMRQKEETNKLKTRLEHLREQMIIDNMNNSSEEIPEHPQESKVHEQINKLRQAMRQNTDKLRELKAETESITVILQRNKEIYTRDLNRYLEYIYKQRQEAMKGVDRSVLIPSVKDDQLHKTLLSYEKAREQIRNR